MISHAASAASLMVAEPRRVSPGGVEVDGFTFFGFMGPAPERRERARRCVASRSPEAVFRHMFTSVSGVLAVEVGAFFFTCTRRGFFFDFLNLDGMSRTAVDMPSAKACAA